MQDKLDQADIQWDLHLFADTVSSDAGSIGSLIEQVANKVNAELVVLAQHNKVRKAAVAAVSTLPCKLFLATSSEA